MTGRSALPPGPGFRLWSTLHYMLDPFEYYSACVEKYGDPFTLPTLYGTLVVTGDPEHVKTIFTAPADTYDIFARTAVEPLFGPTSLMLVTGERHRRDRKLLAPPFHGERMRAYGSLIAEVTRRRCAHWEPGKPFVVQETTQEISLEIILRAVLGAADERVSKLREAIIATHRALNPLIVLFRGARRELGGVGPWANFRRAVRHLDDVLQEHISQRRSAPPGEDVLSLLLSAKDESGQPMSDSDLRDELTTLLTAGHETTAIALAWALYWLHRYPETKERLLAELEPLWPDLEPDKVAALPYLDAVCSEALRLYPIIPEVTRLLQRPLELAGYALQPGMGVAAVAGLTHFRPSLFPDPLTFRPERFLERKFTPFEYLPFGGGARRCVGLAFAIFEMKIALAVALCELRLRLADGRAVRPVRHSVPVGPKGGVRMVLEGRRPSR